VGQFGSALILSPFNYFQGYAWGVELRGNYTIDLYASVTRRRKEQGHRQGRQHARRSAQPVRQHQIRSGTSVGVGAPQWGAAMS
jgi:hypothetical protein